MLLNIPQCPGQLPKINNYPALNVKGIEVEKSYSMPTHLRETHSARISKCFFMSVLH